MALTEYAQPAVERRDRSGGSPAQLRHDEPGPFRRVRCPRRAQRRGVTADDLAALTNYPPGSQIPGVQGGVSRIGDGDGLADTTLDNGR
ncbi:hypothetical protein Airi01_047840 [Actinoallomurus iriomotensis]|uniref:Uncharacterized protein n=1 Tax=Actinoallomurus iriomotensis TaxID=478107 RepID=A0A9W6RM30_9ACTN|nr:hypothetical protein Airi01_047840 [Actinoallomurus iriomotensis]